MPKIILKTGESLSAVQGFINQVPFKCWDKNGSEAFRARILERNTSNAAYSVLGPMIKGLGGLLKKGGKKGAKTRKLQARGGRRRGAVKQLGPH